MAVEDAFPTPRNSAGRGRAAHQVPSVPPGTGLLGMRLFLLALFMLFAAAMVGYVFVRLLAEHPRPAMHHPPLLAGRLHFPHLFWLSTVLVIGTSFALSRAFKYVRLERQRSF